MKLHHLPYTTCKNKFKMVKDLSVKSETIKIIEDNTGSKILDIARSNILLDISPPHKKVEKNKWDDIKLKACNSSFLLWPGTLYSSTLLERRQC